MRATTLALPRTTATFHRSTTAKQNENTNVARQSATRPPVMALCFWAVGLVASRFVSSDADLDDFLS